MIYGLSCKLDGAQGCNTSTLSHLDDHLNKPRSLVSWLLHTTAKMAMEGNRFIYTYLVIAGLSLRGAAVWPLPRDRQKKLNEERKAKWRKDTWPILASSWSGFSQNYGYHSGYVWRNFALCPFQCISFTVPQWSRFHWDVFVEMSSSPVRPDSEKQIQGCLCEPPKLCGRWGNTWVHKHQTKYHTPKEIGQFWRLIFLCFVKMIIWNFDPWKTTAYLSFFGGLAKYVQDCDQTKTSHLQSCLLTCFSLNPQEKRDYVVTMFFFQGFCQCRWATNLFVL